MQQASLSTGPLAAAPPVTNAQAPSGPVPQTQAPQPPQAPAPTAVAAWHGSPAPDGNGTWYYQPGPDPQQGGVTTNGYPVNGMTQNGYAQQDQGTGPTASLNGLPGMQQYAPAQPAAVTGYPQAPQQPMAQQPQLGQPAQAQPAQAAQGPSFGQPLAQPAPQQAPPPAGMPLTGMPAPAPPTAAPAVTAQPVQSAPSVTVPLTAPPSAAPQQATQPPLAAEPVAPQAMTQQQAMAQQAATQQQATQPAMTQPLSAPLAAPLEAGTTGPLTTLPPAAQPDQASSHTGLTAGGALSKLTGAVRGRRAARKPRLAMSSIFADLVDMADIPRSAYSVDEEITGAMCLFKTDGGYEVFSCAEDARHEVRFFEEEEAAYFYLFGVLAAEALRNGRLSPRRS